MIMKWLLSCTSVTQPRKIPRILVFEFENFDIGDFKYESGGREITLQIGRLPTISGELTGLAYYTLAPSSTSPRYAAELSGIF